MAEKKKKKKQKKKGVEDPEEEILVSAEDYAHSAIHFSIATGDLRRLSAILASLPRLRPASSICSAAAAAAEELLAEQISNSLDRRDVPGRETPLHLAVRLNRLAAVAVLLAAGADPSLQNAAGWTPLQESVHLRKPRHLSLLLLRHQHAAAWHKWRRRLPSLLAALHQIPDFYVEISFHFESSLLPFLHAAAPSDTCRIWKRGASIRADVSAAGFDGLRLLRADQSFVFLGDGDEPGSLLLLRHGRKEIYDTLEAARTPMSVAEEEEFLSDSAMFRPGVDVTRAEFVPRTNWRGKEKTETVAQWKARAYEMQNVVFSFKTRRRRRRRRRELPLELNLEEDDEGFLVADVGDLAAPPRPRQEEEDDGHGRRRSVDSELKEKELVKNLRPWVWLTEDFPLHVAELTPVLDVLAGKVKAARRLRDVLTAKLPPGTFPVKIAIPVVPTVRVVVKFNKFVPLSPVEQFFTPPTSPREIASAGEDDCRKEEATWWGGKSATAGRTKCVSPSPLPEELIDPFAIPGDYAWTSLAARRSGKVRRVNSKKVK